MKDFHQASKFEGSKKMNEKTSLTRPAHEPLVPFKTCLRVGMFTLRIESREGRAHTVEGRVAWLARVDWEYQGGRLGKLMRRGCRRGLALKESGGGKRRTTTRTLLRGTCVGAVKAASLMLGKAIDTSAFSVHAGAVSAGACAVMMTARHCWQSSI